MTTGVLPLSLVAISVVLVGCIGAPARPTVRSQPAEEVWTSPADSTFKGPIKTWGDPCLASTGCPFEAAPIPQCSRGQKPTENWRSRIGSTNSVLGTLEHLPNVTIQEGCRRSDSECCDRVTATIVLLTEHGRVVLISKQNPHAFSCGGDPSLLCCGFDAPKGKVLVRGLLRQRGDGRGYLPFELTEPTMCGVSGAN